MVVLADKFQRIGLLLIALLCLALNAGAEPVRDGKAEAELITDVSAPLSGREFWVGVRLRPDEGWHSYWQNPGDTGLATSVKWRLPDGVSVSPLYWPIPRSHDDGGLVSYVYEGEVVLPVLVRVPEDWPADKPVSLEATVNWLVCKETCVMGEGNLSLNVPLQQVPQEWSQKMHQAQEQLPLPSPECRARWSSDGRILLSLEDRDFDGAKSAYFFSTAELVVEPSAKQPIQATGEGLEITLTRAEANPQSPDKLEGVVVVENDGVRRGYIVSVPIQK